MSKKTVLIIGGSFGGLAASSILASKFEVTLVDQKQFFEFTPSFHYLLADLNTINTSTADIGVYAAKNKFEFICGRVSELTPKYATIVISNTSSEEVIKHHFDYCIIASGSNYASNVKSPQTQTLVQRTEQLQQISNRLRSSSSVLIIGGGAVGVEIASQLPFLSRQLEVHLWTKGDEVLPALPPRARRLALTSLTKNGVRVSLRKSIDQLPNQGEFDHVFDCRGNINQPEFMKNSFMQSHVDSRGRIIVDQYLRLEDIDNIFSIGDACITPVNEAKMSYNATIQGTFAAENIIETDKKAKSNKPLKLRAINQGPKLYAITTGKRSAILAMGKRIAFENCLIHYMKMMIEWIAVNNIKGRCGFSTLAYLQKQMLIFFACLINCCSGSDTSNNSSSNRERNNQQQIGQQQQQQQAQQIRFSDSNREQLNQSILKAD